MTSPVAQDFARKIAPRLAAELEERKETLIAGAGSFPIRAAARLAFPVALKSVPEFTEAGCESLLDEFGSMTLAEVANRLYQHQAAKGRTVHPSLRSGQHP